MKKFVRRNQGTKGIQAPKWNLAFVLHRLNQAPFEPLEQADLKYLTWKTAFLVILGTACRRSELHALDFSSMRKDPKWWYVELCTLPEFEAKYQYLDPDPSVPRTYTLKAIQASSSEDTLSCPVRALKVYLERTANKRAGRNRLFLPISNSAKDISANTVSSWVKQTLLHCYAYSGKPLQDEFDRRLFSVSDSERQDFTRPAHEIRALSSTYAFAVHHHSLTAIMRACYWRCHTVFTSFYLKRVSIQDNKDLFRLASKILPGGSEEPRSSS